MQALFGEMSVFQGITGIVQTDNQSVADEHIFANAFEFNNVLDSRCRVCAGRGENHHERGHRGGEECPKTVVHDFVSRFGHFRIHATKLFVLVFISEFHANA